MKCLRCGHCCINYMVVIVSDPEKGLSDDNLECHEGNGPCKYLEGDTIGQYSCRIHHYPWYNQTPCFSYDQIESSNLPCRIGEFKINAGIV